MSRRFPVTSPSSPAHDTIPEPPKFIQAEAATAAELVPTLKANLANAREVLGGMDDEKLMATWRLMSGGKEIMAMPRAAVIRIPRNNTRGMLKVERARTPGS
jgi:hypothetical protein